MSKKISMFAVLVLVFGASFAKSFTVNDAGQHMNEILQPGQQFSVNASKAEYAFYHMLTNRKLVVTCHANGPICETVSSGNVKFAKEKCSTGDDHTVTMSVKAGEASKVTLHNCGRKDASVFCMSSKQNVEDDTANRIQSVLSPVVERVGQLAVRATVNVVKALGYVSRAAAGYAHDGLKNGWERYQQYQQERQQQEFHANFSEATRVARQNIDAQRAAANERRMVVYGSNTENRLVVYTR